MEAKRPAPLPTADNCIQQPSGGRTELFSRAKWKVRKPKAVYIVLQVEISESSVGSQIERVLNKTIKGTIS